MIKQVRLLKNGDIIEGVIVTWTDGCVQKFTVDKITYQSENVIDLNTIPLL